MASSMHRVPCDTAPRCLRGCSMPAADKAPDGFVYDALHQLRHDLKSPLTTIRGRAYLLARAGRRAPSLTEDERLRMLDGVAEIETAVAVMVAVIEAFDRDTNAGPADGMGC